MSNNINDSNVVILILLLIAGLIIYQLFFSTNKHSCPACKCDVHSEATQCPACAKQLCPQLPEEKQIIVNIHDDNTPQLPPIVNPAREYDYRTFNDPLVPPYKRSDYDRFPPVATRGYPSAFKKMGLLNDQTAPNDDKFKFMAIMGRQTYPGSNQYDYYITENKDESSLKFDMKDMHKELNDGDTVIVSDLNKTYTIKLDRDLGFRYTPFLF